MKNKKRFELPLTVAGAMAITAFFLWLIAALNSRAVADLPDSGNERSVVIQGSDTNSTKNQEKEDRPKPDLETELMTVDLDNPTPDRMQPEPLDLNNMLASPDMESLLAAASAAAKPESQSSAVRRANEVDQPPRESSGNPSPVYPARERRLGIEATVRLRILINESGNVEDFEFIRGPEVFQRAVMDVVRRWRFTPANHQGQRVKIWAVKEVQFRRPRGSR